MCGVYLLAGFPAIMLSFMILLITASPLSVEVCSVKNNGLVFG